MSKDAKRWLEKIQRAEKMQKNRKEDSIRYKKGYTGDFNQRSKNSQNNFNSGGKSRGRMNVNFIYQTVETISPELFAGDPKIIVEPKRDPNKVDAAKNFQQVINYWLRETGSSDEFEDALFDSFFGPAAIETGWEIETIEIKDKNGKKKIQTLKDRPFIRWIDYWNDLVIDPDVRRHRHARWMAVREVITIDDFMAIKKIPEKLKKRIKPQMRPIDVMPELNTSRDFDTNEGGKSEQEWVNLWTVWDKSGMRRLVVTPEIDEVLIDDPWPYEFEVGNDIFPITILDAKKDPFSPQTFSEFQPIEEQIWERNRLRTVQTAILRRLAPRLLYSDKTATRTEIKKFLNSDITAAVKMTNPQGLINAPVPEIPRDLFNMDGILKDDLGNVSGLNEFKEGKLAQTATEASISSGQLEARKNKRSQKFTQFVTTVAAKMGGIVQQFQTREMTIKIKGDAGDLSFLNVSPEEMKGEFDYSIEPGSMEHSNEMLRKRELLRFAEIMINNSEVNQAGIAREIALVFKLDPNKLLLTDEQKQAAQEPPEPTLEIEKLKYQDMEAPDRRRFIEAAKKQNSVESVETPSEEALEAKAAQMNGGVDTAELPGGQQVPVPEVQPFSEDQI